VRCYKAMMMIRIQLSEAIAEELVSHDMTVAEIKVEILAHPEEFLEIADFSYSADGSIFESVP